jgi:hypothetical protein
MRGALARAEVRDKAQVDLKSAITAWTKTTPAASTTPESTGPVAFALAALGIQVGGRSQLISSLIMAIVEGGAIIVPMLIGAASRAGARGSQPGRRRHHKPRRYRSQLPRQPGQITRPHHLPRFHLASPIAPNKQKIERRQYYLPIRLRHPAQGWKGVGQARPVTA